MPLNRPKGDFSAFIPPLKSVTRGGSSSFPPSVRYLLFGVLLLAFSLILLAAHGAGHLGRPVVQEDAGAGTDEATSSFVRSELPLEVNDRIDRWVRRYLVEDRATFEMFLQRQGLYGEMIRERLEARGMPAELLYIPMIESAFDAEATSEGSAVGIWQFMDATARAYGLVVDESIDERRDPVRATEAALDYLSDLHEMFGSWPLAVAAYNAGPEAVKSALRRAGGVEGAWKEDLFWKIRGELPIKNREYLPKLLAVALISQNAAHFGFRGVLPLPPYEFDSVLVPGGTTLGEIARSLNLPINTLRDLNPHLLADAAPKGGTHLLRVPRGDAREVASVFSTGNRSGRGN